MDKKVRTVDYKCACLSCEVLEDGCTVDSCCCPNSAMAGGPHLEMSVYPSHWELETCPSGPGDRLRLDLGILPSFTSSLCVCLCWGMGGVHRSCHKTRNGRHFTGAHTTDSLP